MRFAVDELTGGEGGPYPFIQLNIAFMGLTSGFKSGNPLKKGALFRKAGNNVTDKELHVPASN